MDFIPSFRNPNDPTKEQDKLFVGQPSRELTNEESWKLWDRAYRGGTALSAEESRGYHIICAWRLTRLLGLRQVRLGHEDRIHAAFPSEDDWNIPHPVSLPTARVHNHSVLRFRELLATEGGIALTPGTDPGHRKRFSEAMEILAEGSYMIGGSKEIPQLGEYGLGCVTELDWWPTPEEIIQFEMNLVEKCQKLTLKKSRREVQQLLRDQLGIAVAEARGIMNAAIHAVREESALDVDAKRAMMESWLEDLLERAREDGDKGTETRVLKMLSELWELQEQESGTTAEMFLTAMAKVAQAKPKIELLDNNGERLE